MVSKFFQKDLREWKPLSIHFQERVFFVLATRILSVETIKSLNRLTPIQTKEVYQIRNTAVFQNLPFLVLER